MTQISNQSRGPERMAFKIKSNCLQFSFLLAFLLFCLHGLGQTGKPGQPAPSAFPGIDDLLIKNQKALGNNLVALVWKDGKMVYQKQLEKELGEFNAKTQAPVGSCSQWLTAALVMTFVDEGKLSLDDKVSKFIPLFGKYMKSYITIRNCLTHTTGIQADASGAMKILQKSKFESLEDEVNSFASKREIQANPGMEVYYSHVGFNIAGRVLEIISKKNFDRLMQERIIRPLKMRSTTISDENGGAVNPSAGALSTANDYMNFLVMLLDTGMFQGKRVLSQKSVQEMENMQFIDLPVKYVPKEAAGWRTGLGDWIEADAADQTAVIGSLNLSGTWPFIDRCRHYAAILMLKNPTSEPKKEIYHQFKMLIDAQYGSNCK